MGKWCGLKQNNGILAVHAFNEHLQCTLQVCHGDIFVHHQTLYLMEQRRMGSIHLVCTVQHDPEPGCRIGGFWFSMTRIWIGEVCVLKTTLSLM